MTNNRTKGYIEDVRLGTRTIGPSPGQKVAIYKVAVPLKRITTEDIDSDECHISFDNSE